MIDQKTQSPEVADPKPEIVAAIGTWLILENLENAASLGRLTYCELNETHSETDEQS